MVKKDKRIRVRAVLADAGHILFDESSNTNSFITYWNELDEKLKEGQVLDKKKFESVYSKNKDKIFIGECDKKEAYKDTLKKTGFSEYFSDFMQWMGKKGRASRKLIKLNPGVKETVRKLYDQGIDFIIVSDSSKTGEEIRASLEAIGLDYGVVDVVSSFDVKAKKPRKAIFDYALRVNGLRMEEVVFLAHDLDELSGANRLGYRTVALNYAEDIAGKINYSRKIRKFSDLLSILSKDDNPYSSK